MFKLVSQKVFFSARKHEKGWKRVKSNCSFADGEGSSSKQYNLMACLVKIIVNCSLQALQ